MMTIHSLVFFDLDGTLLNERSEITPEVKAALTQLRENGHIPFIATGRPPVEIKKFMAETEIDSLIAMNGQYGQINGQQIFSHTIPDDLILKLYHTAHSQGHELAYLNTLARWISAETPAAINAFRFVNEAPPAVDPLIFQNEPINMLLVLGEGGDDYYPTQFPELAFYRNTPYSMDVVPKGQDKGTGVKELIQRLKLTGIPTLAFGDGPNDLALFDAVDTKIAMGNAREELKAKADFITTDHSSDGIVRGLRHYQLID